MQVFPFPCRFTVAVASIGLCACTTTKPETGPALAPIASVTLPDTVLIVPYSRDAEPIVLALAPVVVVDNSSVEGPVVQASLVVDETAQPIAFVAPRGGDPAVAPLGTPNELDSLITRYAALYEVPVELVRRVVKRESNFRPHARNGPYWGLMQILPATARGMGYQGTPSGLLDAETNLKYAVKYLRGAWLIADGSHDRAVGFYSRGYYYDAKRRGMLDETGLGRDRRRTRGA